MTTADVLFIKASPKKSALPSPPFFFNRAPPPPSDPEIQATAYPICIAIFPGHILRPHCVSREGMLLTIRTPRLLLRPWRDQDVEAFAAMFDDPRVMEFLLPPPDRAAIDALVGRIRAHFDQHGYGWWAAELQETGAFIGFIGLVHIPFDAHFTPAVEVGWRLASAYWGHGYATEGARASLAVGFTQLGLSEIVSITVPANQRSWRVMERIGMTRDPADDFEHPRVPDGSPMKRHVLYRIDRARWQETRGRT
jgi:RimJ/RimL family protein N-acetyltransferase